MAYNQFLLVFFFFFRRDYLDFNYCFPRTDRNLLILDAKDKLGALVVEEL